MILGPLGTWRRRGRGHDCATNWQPRAWAGGALAADGRAMAEPFGARSNRVTQGRPFFPTLEGLEP